MYKVIVAAVATPRLVSTLAHSHSFKARKGVETLMPELDQFDRGESGLGMMGGSSIHPTRGSRLDTER